GEATYSDRLALTMHRHGYDEETWFTYSYSPVRNEGGDVSGIYCACVEVTEQVLAEKYRNEENERFRTLFEQAPGFMAILRGPDHIFDLTNEAYYQLVGHRDVLGKSVREALPEVTGQGFYELLNQVYVTGEPFVGHAVPIKLQREPNGPLAERFVDFVYQPIRDARGAVTGIFAEGNDVTERKQAEQELRQLAADLSQANQRQSEFLATLAHELRNPLAPIRTGLDVMRMTRDNPALVARAREMMERQLDHLVHLVNDLLDLARINTGKIEIRKTRALLKDIVLAAVETALPDMKAKHQDFSLDIPAEPIWLNADVNRLAQVISNILTNARKYTPANGRIALSVRREGDEAVIAVADTGIGIPTEALPSIFDIFMQVRHDIDHSQGGLGIGLSLVKRLTEKHGGTVSAFSAGPGRGATFTIRLPIASSELEMADAAQEGANTEAAKQRPMRILIADDNQDAAELIRQLLEIRGHVIETAPDGKAALETAKKFLPDLALLDLGMPVMNGYELARVLRTLPQFRSTCLVAVTGWGTKEDKDRTRDAGFDHHLIKPVDLQTLDRLIAVIQSSLK
ncbi:MAG TPA: ATP-binding protein, partial [Noviherbaspirillum sp.]|uniref:hybrid sensor histidine kinase/response regulator n=1 Tax=Noviherbaspirillum sp. TaxID=1926288 RepID=UPI002DDCBEE7